MKENKDTSQTNTPPVDDNDEVRALLKKNIDMMEKMNSNIKYIKRYVISAQVFSILKILIILIPVALGILYLPPLLKDVYGQYQELLGLIKTVK